MTYEQSNQSRASIEYLTASDAIQILEASLKTGRLQRAISPQRVRSYETEIRQKRWALTPTHCIGIADDGFIVDGRHRLSAVAALGKTNKQVVPMWVCRGVDPNIFSVIDRGLARTDFQITQMAGSLLNRAQWSSIKLAVLNVEQAKKGALPRIVNVDDVAAIEAYFKDACKLAFPTDFRGYSNLQIQGFRAALVRAFKSRLNSPVDTQKIKNFLYSTVTGEYVQLDQTKERIPLILNAYLVTTNTRSTDPSDIYKLTLKALSGYMQGLKPHNMSKIKEYKDIDNKVFPLSIDDKHKAGDTTWVEFIRKSG